MCADVDCFKQCSCCAGLAVCLQQQVLVGYIVLAEVRMEDQQLQWDAEVQLCPSGNKRGKTILWDQKATYTKQQPPVKLPVHPDAIADHPCAADRGIPF